MEIPKFLLTGPSGAGKTTLLKFIRENFPEIVIPVSTTTRLKRPDEVEGKDYFFRSVEEFQHKIDNNEFEEWKEVYEGGFYGMEKKELQRVLSLNRPVMWDLDIEGAKTFLDKKNNLEPEFQSLEIIGIRPSTPEILHERLKKRATEDEKEFAKRIKKAETEFIEVDDFGHLIINDSKVEMQNKAKSLIQEIMAMYAVS